VSLASSIQQFKIRLETNPKLGVMLITLVIALWVYGLFEILDWSDDLEKERIDAQKKYDIAQDLAKETFWEERKLISQELLKTLEARLWPIENEGLVRANLAKELTQLTEKSGLERARVTIDPKPVIEKNAPNYKKFVATITAPGVKLTSVEMFLDELAHEERLFILQSFELRVKPFPLFKITLSVIMPIGDEKKAGITQLKKGAQK
jgi:hypothetical protein